jgi:hypothetical protein
LKNSLNPIFGAKNIPRVEKVSLGDHFTASAPVGILDRRQISRKKSFFSTYWDQ